jgi:hypothetical protein
MNLLSSHRYKKTVRSANDTSSSSMRPILAVNLPSLGKTNFTSRTHYGSWWKRLFDIPEDLFIHDEPRCKESGYIFVSDLRNRWTCGDTKTLAHHIMLTDHLFRHERQPHPVAIDCMHGPDEAYI